MKAATTCAKCYRATSPLPTDWSALDFFDRPVAAQDAVFRTSCTAAIGAEKPCLRPAPAPAAATPSMPTGFESELFELRNIIGLAAFAAEARRVLTEVDQVAVMHPALGDTLSKWIGARTGWRELGDHAGDVLNDVRQRLDTLLGDEGNV